MKKSLLITLMLITSATPSLSEIQKVITSPNPINIMNIQLGFRTKRDICAGTSIKGNKESMENWKNIVSTYTGNCETTPTEITKFLTYLDSDNYAVDYDELMSYTDNAKKEVKKFQSCVCN